MGRIKMVTGRLHTVKPLKLEIPKGRLTVVTGVSGSGKTTMVIESLVPALASLSGQQPLPPHVADIDADGIKHVKLIDSTPIGANVRSTVATYANVHDDLRRMFARTPTAREHGYKAGDFHITRGVCGALCVTERALLVWMSSFCQILTYRVRAVGDRGIQRKPTRCTMTINRVCSLSRSLWGWTLRKQK